MSTEQTSAPVAVDSVSTAIDAMEAKLFGTQPEEPTSEAVADPQGDEQAQGDDEPSDDAASSTSDFVDIEDDDGATYRVPPALKESFLRRKDYTEKTQRLAAQQEQTNDRADYLQAREAVMAEVMADVGQLRALQTEHAKYAALDWQALYNADPGQALKLRDQRDQLEKQMAQAQGTIQQKAQRIEKNAADHAGYQWDYAVKGAAERIGKVTPQEDAAMLKAVQTLGFTEKELKSRFADPRFLHAMWKAAKWDMLQGSKVQSLEVARRAPPVIKPGSSDPAMSAKMQNLNWAKQIKNASNNTERVKLAENRMTRFFGK
jgi:hypothetical protein